jgi:hypothetical protein
VHARRRRRHRQLRQPTPAAASCTRPTRIASASKKSTSPASAECGGALVLTFDVAMRVDNAAQPVKLTSSSLAQGESQRLQVIVLSDLIVELIVSQVAVRRADWRAERAPAPRESQGAGHRRRRRAAALATGPLGTRVHDGQRHRTC